MKSPGVIRIEGHSSLAGLGVLCAEKEDGRGYSDFLATNTGKAWVYEIPLTDANIALAGSYWKARGWKVSVEYFPVVNPYSEEAYLAWKAEDDKKQADEQKKVKSLEADLAKINKSIPGLDSTFQEEFNKWMAARGEAEAKRIVYPEKPQGLIDSDIALNNARKKAEDVQLEIDTLKRGILQ